MLAVCITRRNATPLANGQVRRSRNTGLSARMARVARSVAPRESHPLSSPGVRLLPRAPLSSTCIRLFETANHPASYFSLSPRLWRRDSLVFGYFPCFPLYFPEYRRTLYVSGVESFAFRLQSRHRSAFCVRVSPSFSRHCVLTGGFRDGPPGSGISHAEFTRMMEAFVKSMEPNA